MLWGGGASAPGSGCGFYPGVYVSCRDKIKNSAVKAKFTIAVLKQGSGLSMTQPKAMLLPLVRILTCLKEHRQGSPTL